MALRPQGTLVYNKYTKHWVLSDLDPYVLIRLKNIFPSIKMNLKTIAMIHSESNCLDLEWFISRHPMRMKPSHRRYLKRSCERYRHISSKADELISSDYVPRELKLGDITLRDYQTKFVRFAHLVKRTLLGDVVGIGKTYQYLALASNPNCLPMAVTVQTHLPNQLIKNIKELYPDATYYYFKTGMVKNPPKADFYIFKYGLLAKYIPLFPKLKIKTAVFDEIQELRRTESRKYEAAQVLSRLVEYCIGSSATPVYNYGDEAYAIFDIIREGFLGKREDFNREWLDFTSRRVRDPQALGTYLRENKLFIRRTREEVGRELPPVNKIVEYVDTDQAELTKFNELAKKLAVKALQGGNLERGQARMDLDIMVRQATGISKARGIANYVRLFLENGEKVLLGLWHREVYRIILEQLEEFNPQMYSGSESPKQKQDAYNAFINGQSNLMCMSLRSGAGLDGLQEYCNVVIFGELDWSPQVMEQFTGRLNRDAKGGEQKQVTEVYLLSNGGSDPVLVDLLGIKASQASGIVDPFGSTVKHKVSDETRLEKLAKLVLEKNGLSSED
jgi:SNF2 family DNA or RNA helicase